MNLFNSGSCHRSIPSLITPARSLRSKRFRFLREDLSVLDTPAVGEDRLSIRKRDVGDYRFDSALEPRVDCSSTSIH
jgi:hypothetical protein